MTTPRTLILRLPGNLYTPRTNREDAGGKALQEKFAEALKQMHADNQDLRLDYRESAKVRFLNEDGSQWGEPWGSFEAALPLAPLFANLNFSQTGLASCVDQADVAVAQAFSKGLAGKVIQGPIPERMPHEIHVVFQMHDEGDLKVGTHTNINQVIADTLRNYAPLVKVVYSKDTLLCASQNGFYVTEAERHAQHLPPFSQEVWEGDADQGDRYEVAQKKLKKHLVESARLLVEHQRKSLDTSLAALQSLDGGVRAKENPTARDLLVQGLLIEFDDTRLNQVQYLLRSLGCHKELWPAYEVGDVSLEMLLTNVTNRAEAAGKLPLLAQKAWNYGHLGRAMLPAMQALGIPTFEAFEKQEKAVSTRDLSWPLVLPEGLAHRVASLFPTDQDLLMYFRKRGCHVAGVASVSREGFAEDVLLIAAQQGKLREVVTELQLSTGDTVLRDNILGWSATPAKEASALPGTHKRIDKLCADIWRMAREGAEVLPSDEPNYENPQHSLIGYRVMGGVNRPDALFTIPLICLIEREGFDALPGVDNYLRTAEGRERIGAMLAGKQPMPRAWIEAVTGEDLPKEETVKAAPANTALDCETRAKSHIGYFGGIHEYAARVITTVNPLVKALYGADAYVLYSTEPDHVGFHVCHKNGKTFIVYGGARNDGREPGPAEYLMGATAGMVHDLMRVMRGTGVPEEIEAAKSEHGIAILALEGEYLNIVQGLIELPKAAEGPSEHAVLVKRADKCVKLARLELGYAELEQRIENRALELMPNTDEELDAKLQHLESMALANTTIDGFGGANAYLEQVLAKVKPLIKALYGDRAIPAWTWGKRTFQVLGAEVTNLPTWLGQVAHVSHEPTALLLSYGRMFETLLSVAEARNVDPVLIEAFKAPLVEAPMTQDTPKDEDGLPPQAQMSEGGKKAIKAKALLDNFGGVDGYVELLRTVTRPVLDILYGADAQLELDRYTFNVVRSGQAIASSNGDGDLQEPEPAVLLAAHRMVKNLCTTAETLGVSQDLYDNLRKSLVWLESSEVRATWVSAAREDLARTMTQPVREILNGDGAKPYKVNAKVGRCADDEAQAIVDKVGGWPAFAQKVLDLTTPIAKALYGDEALVSYSPQGLYLYLDVRNAPEAMYCLKEPGRPATALVSGARALVSDLVTRSQSLPEQSIDKLRKALHLLRDSREALLTLLDPKYASRAFAGAHEAQAQAQTQGKDITYHPMQYVEIIGENLDAGRVGLVMAAEDSYAKGVWTGKVEVSFNGASPVTFDYQDVRLATEEQILQVATDNAAANLPPPVPASDLVDFIRVGDYVTYQGKDHAELRGRIGGVEGTSVSHIEKKQLASVRFAPHARLHKVKTQDLRKADLAHVALIVMHGTGPEPVTPAHGDHVNAALDVAKLLLPTGTPRALVAKAVELKPMSTEELKRLHGAMTHIAPYMVKAPEPLAETPAAAPPALAEASQNPQDKSWKALKVAQLLLSNAPSDVVLTKAQELLTSLSTEDLDKLLSAMRTIDKITQDPAPRMAAVMKKEESDKDVELKADEPPSDAGEVTSDPDYIALFKQNCGKPSQLAIINKALQEANDFLFVSNVNILDFWRYFMPGSAEEVLGVAQQLNQTPAQLASQLYIWALRKGLMADLFASLHDIQPRNLAFAEAAHACPLAPDHVLPPIPRDLVKCILDAYGFLTAGQDAYGQVVLDVTGWVMPESATEAQFAWNIAWSLARAKGKVRLSALVNAINAQHPGFYDKTQEGTPVLESRALTTVQGKINHMLMRAHDVRAFWHGYLGDMPDDFDVNMKPSEARAKLFRWADQNEKWPAIFTILNIINPSDAVFAEATRLYPATPPPTGGIMDIDLFRRVLSAYPIERRNEYRAALLNKGSAPDPSYMHTPAGYGWYVARGLVMALEQGKLGKLVGALAAQLDETEPVPPKLAKGDYVLYQPTAETTAERLNSEIAGKVCKVAAPQDLGEAPCDVIIEHPDASRRFLARPEHLTKVAPPNPPWEREYVHRLDPTAPTPTAPLFQTGDRVMFISASENSALDGKTGRIAVLLKDNPDAEVFFDHVTDGISITVPRECLSPAPQQWADGARVVYVRGPTEALRGTIGIVANGDEFRIVGKGPYITVGFGESGGTTVVHVDHLVSAPVPVEAPVPEPLIEGDRVLYTARVLGHVTDALDRKVGRVAKVREGSSMVEVHFDDMPEGRWVTVKRAWLSPAPQQWENGARVAYVRGLMAHMRGKVGTVVDGKEFRENADGPFVKVDFNDGRGMRHILATNLVAMPTPVEAPEPQILTLGDYVLYTAGANARDTYAVDGEVYRLLDVISGNKAVVVRLDARQDLPRNITVRLDALTKVPAPVPAPAPDTGSKPEAEAEATNDLSMKDHAILAACRAVLLPLLGKAFGGALGTLAEKLGYEANTNLPPVTAEDMLLHAHNEGRLADLADVAWRNAPSKDDAKTLAVLAAQIQRGEVPTLA